MIKGLMMGRALLRALVILTTITIAALLVRTIWVIDYRLRPRTGHDGSGWLLGSRGDGAVQAG